MSSPRLQIELPHKANGETDWKTLGNMLAAHILGEVLQVSYVDYKYGRKSSGFKAATEWEFFYEEHDVVVFRKRFSDSPIYAWLGRCVVDLPPKDVAEFVDNLETRKYWDKYLSEIRIERQLSDVDFIFYLHLVATQCLVKQHRDFTYYERICSVEGKYVRSCLSVDLPEFPPVRGITRAQMLPGTGWVLEPYENNKTLVNFLAHTDLKNLPPLIINRATRRSPMTVYHIREFLTNPVYRSKYEKDTRPERTTDTFTESDLAYLNEQNMRDENLQASNTYSYRGRFHAEEQLSVRDFLRNRPSLKRNYSEPFNLSSSTPHKNLLKQHYRQRSHSHGESMEMDVEDCDSQSTPKAVHYLAANNPTNGVSSKDTSIEWSTKSHEASENQNIDDEDTTQTSLGEFTQEIVQREIVTNTTPFLTPQSSEDESSSFVSPLNSLDFEDRNTTDSIGSEEREHT